MENLLPFSACATGWHFNLYTGTVKTVACCIEFLIYALMTAILVFFFLVLLQAGAGIEGHF